MWPFTRKQKIETRSTMSGFTAELMAARESYISGRRGIAELTGTVQSCVSLWENGLRLADVEGTNLLTRHCMGMIGRALALRGEALFLIRDNGLVPCSDWDLKTVDGMPRAYRLSISEAGGGKTQTALAGEVLHFRIGVDSVVPWAGSAPLKRAQLTAGTLQAIETALSEVYENAPIGSSVVPFPEAPQVDLDSLSRKFRGYRGRVQVRESVNVAAAGGPAPMQDWKPHDLSPDLSKAMTRESLDAMRGSICMVFGLLPATLDKATTGPLIREAQRHLAQWMLQPIAETMAEECNAKLGGGISLDVMRPLQAYDAGGRARAAVGVIQALAMAKEAGVDPAQAMKLVDWKES